MKTWPEEHLRLAIAANRVQRKLLDLANVVTVLEAHPALSSILVELAAQLRRAFRPRRRVAPRDKGNPHESSHR